MAKVQKTYTAEFKCEAVQLAQTSGKPIVQVARELAISDTSIYQWRKALAAHGEEAFPFRTLLWTFSGRVLVILAADALVGS